MSGPDHSLRFLLLEDSVFDAELLEATLLVHWPSAQLTWVKDGESFGRALRAGPFDVILSDFEIPGYSGLDALAAALQVAGSTPFVFVSGVIGEDNAVELLKRGATDYVIKGRYDRLPLVIERALQEAADRRARLAAEAQLKEAGALYARVVDSLENHAVVLLDAAGFVQRCNRASVGMFGRALPAFTGLAADDLIGPSPDGEPGLLPVARERGVATASRWLSRADRQPWRGDIEVTPLFSAVGEHSGYTMIVRDVTEAFRASETMRAAKEAAEHANELKDQFLAVLSHELRSPLSAITGWSEILLRKSGDDPVLSKAGAVIRRSAKTQERLIDDLLAMTSMSAGKLVLHRRPLDLTKLVSEVVLANLRGAQEKGVALTLDRPDPETTVAVDGDPQRLGQIFGNLVVNAIKFTERGGSVRVSVGGATRPGHALVRVADTGRGIAPDFLPHVFDRLRQEDGSSTRSVGGLGLGLSIAQALARMHGGRIEAASDGRGRGATFTVELPRLIDGVAAPEDELDGVDGTDWSGLSTSLLGTRILLVDDESDAREVGQIALTTLGASVVVADNARQALALLESDRFDVLVSDIAMPEIDGLAMMRQVRRLPGCDEKRLPAIALSAMAMTSDRRAGAEAGFQGYVAKPIALPELARAIREARSGH